MSEDSKLLVLLINSLKIKLFSFVNIFTSLIKYEFSLIKFGFFNII